MKVVISLGGSIFSKDEGIDVVYLKRFSKAIKEAGEEYRIFIVAGGGKTARKYIQAGREFGASEDFLDQLGIQATRLNAMLVSASLGGKGRGPVPERIEDVEGSNPEELFVMGGTVPGHSTDAVSAMLAAHVDADLLINATNVDGVYEKDPKKHLDARRFDKLSSKELVDIVTTTGYRAGTSSVVDEKAAGIIHENRIRTAVVDGRDPANIIDAINGKITGTLIEN